MYVIQLLLNIELLAIIILQISHYQLNKIKIVVNRPKLGVN